MYWTSFVQRFSYIVGRNFDLIHPIVTIAAIAAIVLVIRICYELNNVNSIAIRTGIYNKIGYNCNLMDRVTIDNHVCGIFSRIALVIAIGIWIKISSLSLFLHVLLTIFDKIISHLCKLSTIECVDGNYSNVTIIVNNFYKVSGTAIVTGVFSIVIYFASKGINGSLSNITFSIGFDASIAAFAQLILNSTVQLFIGAIYCCVEVIDSVCHVQAKPVLMLQIFDDGGYIEQIAFEIDILFKILFISFLEVLTIIVDGLRLNFATINEIGYIWDNNSDFNYNYK